jgi:hypothetical protein
MRRLVFVLLLSAACTKGEKPAADLIHEVASDVKTKPRVEVSIKLPKDDATPADLQLQKTIEDHIERENVGRLVNSGSRPGSLFITVEVDQTADAIEKLRNIMRTEGVLDRASFRVIAGS